MAAYAESLAEAVPEADSPPAKPSTATRRERKRSPRVELSLEQAVSRIPAGLVQTLQEQLRGEFREVRLYETRERVDEEPETRFEDPAEVDVDPDTD